MVVLVGVVAIGVANFFPEKRGVLGVLGVVVVVGGRPDLIFRV